MVRGRQTLAGVWAWLDDRAGLSAFQYRVPAHANTLWYTLGGITFMGIVVLVITGAWLGQYYNPDPAAARESVLFADGVPSVAVKPLSPRPGDVITVKGDSLGANSVVEVRVIGMGRDVDLGEVRADGGGDFLREFTLPADLHPGLYRVRARGAETATTDITLVAAGGAAPAAGTEAAPVRERPLAEALGLVGVFGAIAALGLFFARTARDPSPSETG